MEKQENSPDSIVRMTKNDETPRFENDETPRFEDCYFFFYGFLSILYFPRIFPMNNQQDSLDYIVWMANNNGTVPRFEYFLFLCFYFVFFLFYFSLVAIIYETEPIRFDLFLGICLLFLFFIVVAVRKVILSPSYKQKIF